MANSKGYDPSITEKRNSGNSTAATLTLFVVITFMMILLATTTEWSTLIRLPLSIAAGFLAAFLVRRFTRQRHGSD